MAAEVIRYGFAQTSIAALLVAVSGQGLVAVLMREHADDAALVRELARRFAKAERIRADQEILPMAEELRSFVERPRHDVALPLDLRASGFAAWVYQAVRNIPFGETRSFAEIARAVGAPKAVRAVGNACARNPIEFAIPCHRVLRGDGRWAGGGPWGDWRQSIIVERERTALMARREGEHA